MINIQKKIVLDFDNVLVNTAKAMFQYYQDKAKDYSIEYNEDLVTWNMEKLIPWSKEKVNDIFRDKDFFAYLEPFKDTIWGLSKLKELGYKIEICSLHYPETMAEKIEWIDENFPMVDSITIIPLHHDNFDKSEIIGDIIVDDRVDILNGSSCNHKILFGNYDWNKDCNEYLRAWDMRDLINIIRTIENK